MSFKVGQRVRLKLDIFRIECPSPYAKKGDTGNVEDIFSTFASSSFRGKVAHAKVRMADGTLKTFRLTSLEVISELE